LTGSAANSAKYRNLSPKQIVPRLADEGRYLGSESTLYRLLRAEGMMKHRGRAKAPVKRPKAEHSATGPHQLWSWDITYMRAVVPGTFFYLYLVLDVWSRKIVGWEVHEHENDDLSSALMLRIAKELGISLARLVLHSDNGGPMKGATMVATLQNLGVIQSFSRPSVSDDNPYSEALFRTMKYKPGYPAKPFETVEEARVWVAEFVRWYNTEHLHSAIRYVTPEARHNGLDLVVLEKRSVVYERARRRHPERWTRSTRNWSHIETVMLNANPRSKTTAAAAAVVTATPPERRPSHPQGRSAAQEARPRALTGPARRLRRPLDPAASAGIAM
jgi:transposase InsO family protein